VVESQNLALDVTSRKLRRVMAPTRVCSMESAIRQGDGEE
jgi:hypothetical protein